MDKVIIKDLLARGIIGINDWERKNPQDILINITVLTDTRRGRRNGRYCGLCELPDTGEGGAAARRDGQPAHSGGAGKRPLEDLPPAGRGAKGHCTRGKTGGGQILGVGWSGNREGPR